MWGYGVRGWVGSPGRKVEGVERKGKLGVGFRIWVVGVWKEMCVVRGEGWLVRGSPGKNPLTGGLLCGEKGISL